MRGCTRVMRALHHIASSRRLLLARQLNFPQQAQQAQHVTYYMLPNSYCTQAHDDRSTGVRVSLLAYCLDTRKTQQPSTSGPGYLLNTHS